MKILIGADHAGFPLKQHLLDRLQSDGHEVEDVGAFEVVPTDDYPDYSLAVAEGVAAGRADRGLIVCGSGVGASIAANKVKGARAAVCHDIYSAGQGVEHDAMNILCIGGRIVSEALAERLVDAFLSAEFSGADRHQRRLEKVAAAESRF